MTRRARLFARFSTSSRKLPSMEGGAAVRLTTCRAGARSPRPCLRSRPMGGGRLHRCFPMVSTVAISAPCGMCGHTCMSNSWFLARLTVKKSFKMAAAALMGLSVLAASATTASAAIACNGAGACWHVHGAYTYAPSYGVVVHPNNWRWGPTDHYAWREHSGRGYWRGGVWVRF